MSKRWRRTQKYRPASDEEVTRVFFLQYTLEELFYDEEIEDFMAIARQSIAGEFYFAQEENPRWKPGSDKKRFRGTDNYIIGVGGRPSDLARLVASKTHRQIINDKLLPSSLRELRPKFVERIIATARYDVVLRTINVMVRNGEIRYDAGIGTWNVNQSNIDDFLDDRAFRKEVRRAIKSDCRPFHGRPGRDRGRVPAGVSVSLA